MKTRYSYLPGVTASLIEELYTRAYEIAYENGKNDQCAWDTFFDYTGNEPGEPISAADAVTSDSTAQEIIESLQRFVAPVGTRSR